MQEDMIKITHVLEDMVRDEIKTFIEKFKKENIREIVQEYVDDTLDSKIDFSIEDHFHGNVRMLKENAEEMIEEKAFQLEMWVERLLQSHKDTALEFFKIFRRGIEDKKKEMLTLQVHLDSFMDQVTRREKEWTEFTSTKEK